MKRQLAAVLAADICDYSRLMGEDSEAMLRALRRLRAEVFGPNIASHHGRIVKSMGDGWIVLFSSAVDAVSSAMRVQDRLAEGGHPDEPEIRMRVGVHLGDVVEEEDDVFGDGVNVAARLEQAAAPGSVTVSEAVYGSLDGTLRPSFDDGGAWELKNIERPVHVWVRGEIPKATTASRTNSDGLKIAVAPVATADDRHEVQELADAITGDVAAFLDATMWISAVISQSEANAKYVLQSYLRSSGDRLRLEVKLVDRVGRVWLKTKLDGNLLDAFDWQDLVGENLTGQVLQTIFDAEQSRLNNLPEPELTAADHTLQAALALERWDRQGIEGTLAHAASALEIEPDRLDALGLALIGFQTSQSFGFQDLCNHYRKRAEQWLEAAKRLHIQQPAFEIPVAWAARFDGAATPLEYRSALERALRRASSDFVVMAYCGLGFNSLGLPQTALDCFRKAIKLGQHTPWRPMMLGGMATAYFQMGRFEKAIQTCDEGLALNTNYATFHRLRAASYAQLGQLDKARAACVELLDRAPDETISVIRSRAGYADTDANKKFLDGLRIAGLPE
ncbi:tetratricopeptide repeat protein [Sulfitobacter sp. JBTF-M27]|uniref:Tetratricopeptide repeat protein n=1 Tax=Sulfitobacter sediminilitoris TaxID=2698830 RepID=A0A6P0CL37_9RHOB|nr:adenylate/guanylate cyclase domain-containing protein [Sulfitobacter sediminilitoris]NEK25194.1 tetratricopeptide repeat protein [Sulfitobacter sediminilitoris]